MGAEQQKALRPTVASRREGMEREREEEDVRHREGMVIWTRSERYEGER